MEIEIGAAIAIGGVIFGAGGAWSIVRNVNAKLADYEKKKDDQARRIGVAEARCNTIEGVLIGMGALMPDSRMRKRAKTFPVPLSPPDEEKADK